MERRSGGGGRGTIRYFDRNQILPSQSQLYVLTGLGDHNKLAFLDRQCGRDRTTKALGDDEKRDMQGPLNLVVTDDVAADYAF